LGTFLSLAQDVRRECGISGVGPSATTNQSGELLRVVNWTKSSWTELQLKKPNWRWMRSKFTVNTVASTDAYAYGSCTDTIASALISRFKRWYPTEFQIYLASAGIGTSHWLIEEDWDNFKRVFKVGTQNASYPSIVTVDPQNNFVLGAKPDGIYTVTGDYQKSAQILAADGDIPEMPSDFHQLIVFGAMRKYAAYSGAPEVWAQAKDEASRMMRELEIDQLPLPGFGDPLA
jgi:hypothetical protein